MKVPKGNPKSKRKAPELTEAIQTDDVGITDDFVIKVNFLTDSTAEAELERLERNTMRSRDIITIIMVTGYGRVYARWWHHGAQAPETAPP